MTRLVVAWLAIVGMCCSAAVADEADFDAGVAAYEGGRFRTAFEAWRDAAADGDPAAERNIGHLYRNGLGVPQDFAKAADWYRRAAEKGLARAQANLGNMYLRGQGVARDPAEAVIWFERAARQGHVISQYNLALLYETGLGIEGDEALAMGWYHLAAKAGHRRSLDRLSGLVARGVRPTSVEELVLPLNEGEAAAEDPEVPADGPIADSDPPTDAGSETALTATTDAGVDAAPTTPTDGEDGTVPSDEGLVAWLAELASPDPAPASAPVRNRARPPEAREGPDGPDAPDAPDAIEWFDDPVRPDASANESVTAALAAAPSANEDGAGPLAAPLANEDGATSPADEPAPEASKPVVEAAEPAFAGLSVGERIDAGLRAYRVRAYDQAMAAWQPLAEGGHTEAQFFVGVLHLEGAGVPRSAATAFFWWTLAEKEGHAKAGEMLALIDREVSDDDHDAMLRRVGAWVPLAPAAPPVASAPVVALLAPPIGLPQPHAPSLAPADVPALAVLLSPYGPGVRLEPGTEALISDQPTGERAATVRPVLPAPAAVLAAPPPGHPDRLWSAESGPLRARGNRP